jgi:hypothetical protein
MKDEDAASRPPETLNAEDAEDAEDAEEKELQQ